MASLWTIVVTGSLLFGATACGSPAQVPSAGAQGLDKTAACAGFKTMRADYEGKVLPDLRKLADRAHAANVAPLKTAVLANTQQHAVNAKTFAGTVSEQELKVALESYAADFDDMDVYITALIPRGEGESATRGVDTGLPGLSVADMIQRKCEGKLTRGKQLACFQYEGIDGLDIQRFLLSMTAFDEGERADDQRRLNNWIAGVSQTIAQLAEQTDDAALKAALQADAKYYEGLKPLLADASKDPAKAMDAVGLPAHAGFEVCLK
ncbi:hypothetical protein [Catelliglobosispora koreensis]|uniref:hypothetical protein n=1 Tax=Catelliglobosispora koreensis TaxID=129052 RepID=UPI00037D5C78|nr:hypothetical protein [Catelliglobosispora koreensis]